MRSKNVLAVQMALAMHSKKILAVRKALAMHSKKSPAVQMIENNYFWAFVRCKAMFP